MSIHEQLRLDDEARGRIAAIKSFDTRTALEQLQDWQAEASDQKTAANANPSSSLSDEEESGQGDSSKKTMEEERPKTAVAMEESVAAAEAAIQDISRKSKEMLRNVLDRSLGKEQNAIWDLPLKGTSDAAAATNCPPIRAGGSLSISFTPREFPTPSRESMAAEEEEVRKN